MTTYNAIFRLYFLLVAAGIFLSPLSVSSQIPEVLHPPKGTVAWPPEVERLASRLYAIKIEAMEKWNMRVFVEVEGATEPELIGKSFVKEMATLAAVTDAQMLAKAETLESKDLVAKFIVMAHDRKNRPEAYETIRSNYVDSDFRATTDPKTGASILPSKVPAPSLPVSRDHLSAEWQLPLEYGFFAPPTGGPARDGNVRSNLYDALVDLKLGEKTNILMLADAASVDAHIEILEKPGAQLQGLRYLTNHPNSVNSTYLESLLAGQKAQHYGKRILETTFWVIPEDPDEALANRLAVWRKWLNYFDENPGEREKSKRQSGHLLRRSLILCSVPGTGCAPLSAMLHGCHSRDRSRLCKAARDGPRS